MKAGDLISKFPLKESYLWKGAGEKFGNILVFYQTPLFGFYLGTKIEPHFFLENASLMAETNFTLGPISKPIKFPL